MNVFVVVFSAALIANVFAAPPGQGSPKDPEKPPADQYRELVEQAREDGMKIGDAGKAKSVDEKAELLKKQRELYQSYADRFLQLAKKHPQDPAASEALIWIIRNVGAYAPEASASAVNLLGRDHSNDTTFLVFVKQWIDRGAIGPDAHFEQLYRVVMKTGKDRETRGRATFLAARCLKFRGELVEELRRDDDLLEAEERCWGPGFTKRLEAGLQDADKERAQLLKEVIKDYADIPFRWRSLGKHAEADLYELQHLAVGCPAPEIEGADLDGNPLKLSEYRGKVVVLVFWGNYSRPCRTMYPELKSLVKDYQGKGVAVLGVNYDEEKAEAKELAAKEGLTWKSWWNGRSKDGPISNRWNIDRIPVVYVFDGRGTIRFKYHGAPGKDLDRAVTTLLKAPSG